MNKLDFKDDLHLKIMKLSQNIWENRVSEKNIDDWLVNFQEGESISDCEKSHALYLLSNFMFFGVREIREMLRSVYRDKIYNPLIQSARKDLDGSKDYKAVMSRYKEELVGTRFLGIGNPSESGAHLLYFFRQENILSKNLFIHSHQIFDVKRSENVKVSLRDPTIKRYIFIDDVCGSGDQAVEYSEELFSNVRDIPDDIELHYITLFSTTKGLKNVRDNTVFDKVECIFELDETFKCFSDTSRYFPSNIELPVNKKFAKDFTLKYSLGMNLSDDDALGYKDGQLLLGFSHNIPDNSLPIIWSEYSGWVPIFKRYTKLYSSLYG
jgi:hypothetical protein